MTLAHTRQDLADATPTVLDAAVDSAPLSSSQLEMMRAFFSCEFEVARLDRESIPVATPDAVAEWIDALRMSGLFSPSEMRTMSAAWTSEPDALVSLLVGDVDEVAARRDVTESSPEDVNVSAPIVDAAADTELPKAS
ncbi:hypothetical protein CH304_17245 [Rhodococcus sp. 15-649-1-2]|nr:MULTISPECIES: hypothetical protein [unclassified Rhodococcus (in: high G+C Gram-positive bacteria)]OZC76293.1 hypothetical protein CH282_25750 [Rhodococcus sp. 06-418-1B]OZE80143.1 hypothetical protein CH304_17245 [Rhodococcus sp. 15-649-1-2]